MDSETYDKVMEKQNLLKSNDGGGRKKASNAQKLKGLFQNTNRQLYPQVD